MTRGTERSVAALRAELDALRARRDEDLRALRERASAPTPGPHGLGWTWLLYAAIGLAALGAVIVRGVATRESALPSPPMATTIATPPPQGPTREVTLPVAAVPFEAEVETDTTQPEAATDRPHVSPRHTARAPRHGSAHAARRTTAHHERTSDDALGLPEHGDDVLTEEFLRSAGRY